MKIIFGADQAVADFIAKAAGGILHAPLRTIAVHGKGGALIAGVAFTNWTGSSVEISSAGRAIVMRSVLQATGDMAYGALGCRRLQMVCRRSNKPMKRLASRLGFAFEGRLRRMYGDEDGMIYSMLSEEAIKLGWWTPHTERGLGSKAA